RDMGRHEEALTVMNEAVQALQSDSGGESPRTMEYRTNVALIHYDGGNYPAAEQIFREVIAFQEKGYGPEFLELATNLIYLGRTLEKQGRFADAEPVLQRALRIREKNKGPKDKTVASALEALGQLYQAAGRLDGAEVAYRRELLIQEGTLGAGHKDTALTLRRLGEVYTERGQFPQAEENLRKAVAVQDKVFSPEIAADEGEKVTTRLALADMYFKQRRYEEADGEFIAATDRAEKFPGYKSKRLAEVLKRHSAMLRSINHDARAAQLEARIEAISQKSAG
ncbi:tetratricopeptide repeat protein, partial [Candidatus Poribacteria bacterium]|nr:tetratricopeptide repeat protein [Candidatus Poribacteria bacterium]